MTWRNRLRLWGTVLGVILIAVVATLIVNQRESRAVSRTAEVRALQFPIGSDYGGVVTRAYVSKNQGVTKGQQLFTVSSLGLQKDISNGLRAASTDVYTVDAKNGTLTYLAPADGTVTEFSAMEGSFVPSGNNMAKITSTNSQFVQAEFRLSPRDYARLTPGNSAAITLPNDTTLKGSVQNVSVQTTAGAADATVTFSVPGLRDGSQGQFGQVGTPVSVDVALTDNSFLAGPTAALRDFLHKIGL